MIVDNKICIDMEVTKIRQFIIVERNIRNCKTSADAEGP